MFQQLQPMHIVSGDGRPVQLGANNCTDICFVCHVKLPNSKWESCYSKGLDKPLLPLQAVPRLLIDGKILPGKTALVKDSENRARAEKSMGAWYQTNWNS
jgi:hypothetical protein